VHEHQRSRAPLTRFPPKRAMRTWMRPYVYAAWFVTPFRLWNNICICKYCIVICISGFLPTP